MLKKALLGFFCFLTGLLFFSGCQEIFTYSFFTAMQPDPADLPDEKLAEYCSDILVNGTAEEKAEAFAALQAAIQAGSTDPEINYIAANLALDQAGLTFNNLISIIDSQDPAAAFGDLLSGNNLDLLETAGNYFMTVDAGDSSLLSATDYIIGGVGIVLGSVDGDTGLIDPNNLSSAQQQGLSAIEQGIAIGGDALIQSIGLSSLAATLGIEGY